MATIPSARFGPLVRSLRQGPAGLDRADALLIGVTLVLIGSLVPTLLPGVEVRLVAEGLDLVVDTVTTLVALAVAVLAWIRFRDRELAPALFEASAFLVLAVASGIAAVSAMASLDALRRGAGPDLLAVTAVYPVTLARLVAAALLVAGMLHGRRAIRRVTVVALGPAVAVLLMAGLAPAWGTALPGLFETGAVASPAPALLPRPTLANVLLQSAGAALFLGGAVLWRRRREDVPRAEAYLAVGLLVAAAAQLHLALYPSAVPGVMTSGDLLYLAVDVILLVGIAAESRTYVDGLRDANLAIVRLRDSDVQRAALEERTRLSRDLHDGVAQDLWYARLKVDRLLDMPDLPPDALVIGNELGAAVESGLANARQAVLTLRGSDGESPLSRTLDRTVGEFTARSGVRVTVESDSSLPMLGKETEQQLLWIVTEALANVRRHADATMVWVGLATAGGRFAMSVRDNGRGFEEGVRPAGAVGLLGMRERVEALGGTLAIETRPHDGTEIRVEVPLARRARRADA